MERPVLTNSLLRCFRQDNLASKFFDLVRPDLDLWVWELPEKIEAISAKLIEARSILNQLKESSDFTLHLAVDFTHPQPFVIPPQLARLTGELNITIEIQSTKTW